MCSPPLHREINRPNSTKRGFSESYSVNPGHVKPSLAGFRLPSVHLQRGYSDGSFLSEGSPASPTTPMCPTRDIRMSMIAEYPPGPGGNPMLDNSALQGIWDIYRKEAGDYDAAMIDSWNASIDNLILFVCRTPYSGCPSIILIFFYVGRTILRHHHDIPYRILQEPGATSHDSQPPHRRQL